MDEERARINGFNLVCRSFRVVHNVTEKCRGEKSRRPPGEDTLLLLYMNYLQNIYDAGLLAAAVCMLFYLQLQCYKINNNS